MRNFTDYERWLDALLEDWTEEYYRAIFEVHCAIANLLRDQKVVSFDYKIEFREEANGNEYHLIDEYYQSTLIVREKQGLQELDRYLTERFKVGANNEKNWENWYERLHEGCRSDRFY